MITLPSNRQLRKGVKKLLNTPIFSPVRSLYSGFGSVLMYHRVIDQERFKLDWDDPSIFRPNVGIAVCRDSFEEQMEWISKNYRCVSLDTFYAV
ncbi:MAG: hypothetical protein KDD55_11260, partial [Bdellovibrionales bacterium]|nr:hypothetical protein [Bdellovibrionales bacterium]